MTSSEEEERLYNELQDSRARRILDLRAKDVQAARALWREWRKNRRIDLEDIKRRMDRVCGCEEEPDGDH